VKKLDPIKALKDAAELTQSDAASAVDIFLMGLPDGYISLLPIVL
jgi:hypothetical protein